MGPGVGTLDPVAAGIGVAFDITPSLSLELAGLREMHDAIISPDRGTTATNTALLLGFTELIFPLLGDWQVGEFVMDARPAHGKVFCSAAVRLRQWGLDGAAKWRLRGGSRAGCGCFQSLFEAVAEGFVTCAVTS